jgi:hypothetical protein
MPPIIYYPNGFLNRGVGKCFIYMKKEMWAKVQKAIELEIHEVYPSDSLTAIVSCMNTN